MKRFVVHAVIWAIGLSIGWRIADEMRAAKCARIEYSVRPS